MNEQSIFLGALQIADGVARSAYLKQACHNDPILQHQVEALIAAHERSGEFLDVPALKQMERNNSEKELGETSAETRAEEREIDLSFLQPSDKPGSLGRLGHHEIEQIIGRGGCGIVLKAFDERLHRVVAIKVMAPELAATSPARKRFLREARAAASICHENVVSIHAVEELPIPFLVMEYVAGQTLQERINQTGPLDPREVVSIGYQIASGLAAAHAMGLIHRDIKPGNILLEKDRDRVKITDFGLARASDDASLTQSGMIAGTPLYMSPEQAQGAAIDHRSDLFSLGSVLYVMCSGRPPFRAATILAVLKRVAEEQPRPIHEIIPEVPVWLAAITAKLHAKQPESRFSTAQEIANVLASCQSQLQQSGRVVPPDSVLSVVAPPEHAERAHSSVPQPQQKVYRQRRWVAVAASLVLLTVLATEATGVTRVSTTIIRLFSPDGTLVVEVDDPGVSVSIDGEGIVITGAGAKEILLKPGQYQVLASKNGKLVRQELVNVTRDGRQVVRVSQESGSTAKSLKPTGPSAVAAANSDTNKPAPTDLMASHGNSTPLAASSQSPQATLANQNLPLPPAPDPLLLGLRREQVSPAALAFAGQGDPTNAPASLVAVLGEPVPIHTAGVQHLAFSPDGRWLASSGRDSELLLWNATTCKALRVLKGAKSGVSYSAFLPDSCTLVTYSSIDGTVQTWNVNEDTAPTKLPLNLMNKVVSVSPDGRYLAAGTQNSMQLWHWGRWDEPEILVPASPNRLSGLWFSPDGETLLGTWMGDRSRSPIGVYQTSDGKLQRTLAGNANWIPVVSFSADGKSFVTCGEGAMLWDRATWQGSEIKLVAGSGRVAMSPDGRTVAQSFYSKLSVWETATKAKTTELDILGTYGLVGCLQFSPDGKVLATGDSNGVVSFLDSANWQPHPKFLGHCHQSAIVAVAVSPDGRTVLSRGQDRTLRSWQPGQPNEHKVVRISPWHDQWLAFAPDGKSYNTGVVFCPWSVWDASTHQESFSSQRKMNCLVQSPDGKYFAGQSQGDLVVRLWDMKRRDEVQQFPTTNQIAFAIAFSSDGEYLALACEPGKIVVWHVLSGREIASWTDVKAGSIAFRPDGRFLYTGHDDGTIRSWDTSTWQKMQTIRAHSRKISTLRFTPDGRTLLSSGSDGEIQIRNSETQELCNQLTIGPIGVPITFAVDASGQFLFASGPVSAVFVHRLQPTE